MIAETMPVLATVGAFHASNSKSGAQEPRQSLISPRLFSLFASSRLSRLACNRSLGYTKAVLGLAA
jgi:hypothetical protein